jgi:hypothetical protein
VRNAFSSSKELAVIESKMPALSELPPEVHGGEDYLIVFV